MMILLVIIIIVINLFLPRDAMLARYMLSSSVCPSVCLSVCLPVCPSQVGVLPRRLNLWSCKQRRTITQWLQFSDAKSLGKI